MSTMLIEAKNLQKSYSEPEFHRVIHNLSLSVAEGETLGLAGNSGCGKSTLSRLLLLLEKADSGEIFLNGSRVLASDKKRLAEFRRSCQIVFQHPYLSLNPRMTVRDIWMEALSRRQDGVVSTEEAIAGLLRDVDLDHSILPKKSGQISGGQCQRVAIARALAVNPKFIICDEVVSALDVFTRAKILNLLLKLQKEKKLAYLFISHDSAAVRHMSDRVLIMRDGNLYEN